MDSILIIVAVIALITGVFLIFAPSTMIQAGEVFNRLQVKAYISRRRGLFGWIFIVLGMVFLILAR